MKLKIETTNNAPTKFHIYLERTEGDAIATDTKNSYNYFLQALQDAKCKLQTNSTGEQLNEMPVHHFGFEKDPITSKFQKSGFEELLSAIAALQALPLN